MHLDAWEVSNQISSLSISYIFEFGPELRISCLRTVGYLNVLAYKSFIDSLLNSARQISSASADVPELTPIIFI